MPLTLYFGLKLNILALFNRAELSRISQTNRCFNAIIEKHFASSPLYILNYIQYSNGVWKWSDAPDITQNADILDAAALPMSDSQIAQLSTSKFLRFRLSDFLFGELSNLKVIMISVFRLRNTSIVLKMASFLLRSYFNFKQRKALKVLKAHKHLWEGYRLKLHTIEFWFSKEFLNLVSTSHYLRLWIPGSVDMLPQLLLGNCKHIILNSITDLSSDQLSAKPLPMDDINNFLFHNSCRSYQNGLCIPFNLIVFANYLPEYCQEITDSIKQKFLETPHPSEFSFGIFHRGEIYWPHAQEWVLSHPHDNKELSFKIFDIYFSFTCSNE
ncbi:hypothetical protein DdX_15258 [Ditylenchus destructor]|uniref:F-box domain-containing protein n=1 Tax=Ditylenchus destructor TaxID=166010 RepID=A0AAD4R143_9BILA|nr:hypothetical protein DdX_15258 [Ditylenchus destructor]